jgi:hypothetical protein
MTFKSCRGAAVGLLTLLAFAPGCRSSRKETDPTVALQGKVDREVREAVKNPETAAQVEKLVQRAIGVLHQMEKEDSAYREQLIALNADYDATPQQFERLFADHRTRRDAFLKESLEIRGRIAGLLTDEEWKKLNGLRSDIRNLDVKAS